MDGRYLAYPTFIISSPPANNSDLIEIPPHIWGNSILKTSPSFERYARAQDLLDLVSLSSVVILFNESAKLAEILLVILSLLAVSPPHSWQ